jgi:hypothetical protein
MLVVGVSRRRYAVTHGQILLQKPRTDQTRSVSRSDDDDGRTWADPVYATNTAATSARGIVPGGTPMSEEDISIAMQELLYEIGVPLRLSLSDI